MVIVKKVEELVYHACKQKTNFYGRNIWEHIKLVVKYSKTLAQKLGADEEICELSAWLHDYAAILNKDWIEDHHLHGSKLAGKVLQEFGYPKDKIKKVKHCIFTHRASKKIPRHSLEAKIVASADAMAHFDLVYGLFYLVYRKKKLGLETGRKWILAKLERSFKKLIPEAKELIKPKYQAIRLLFEFRNSD